MESEAKAILEQMRSVQEETKGFLHFFLGKIGNRDVILSVCGIGKVFAAMCAQTMILCYQPDCLINSGVAGSLSEDLDILDLAVSRDLVQHDMDTSPLGDPVGMISGLNRVFLPAEESLTEEILALADSMGMRAVGGTIASGDQFIATAEQKERIRREFHPLACEMEGAAVAQAAYCNGVPFCVIRSISDSYSGKNEMDYARFASLAAQRSASLLLALLQA
jgi:adenosylhomocysteine nucleosidase